MTKEHTRQAYNITLRCRLNGTEWHGRLFLRSPDDAFNAMYLRARLSSAMRDHERNLGRDWFRVVSCEVSPDQSRARA